MDAQILNVIDDRYYMNRCGTHRNNFSIIHSFYIPYSVPIVIDFYAYSGKLNLFCIISFLTLLQNDFRFSAILMFSGSEFQYLHLLYTERFFDSEIAETYLY